jgi:pyridinium-3,5-biscarboxylic acid mononucleotide sulfurtransferase
VADLSAEDSPSSSASGPLRRLREAISAHERLVVAFSGGADSSLLAYVATALHGPENVLCATAVSASLSDDDEAHCEALAQEWGLRWAAVATGELGDADYTRNDGNRCYYCKRELMSALAPIAAQEQATIALGVNLDDLTEDRPGQVAAAEGGAAFPLVEARLDKPTVREVSRLLGLRTWDRPAAPCLASRVPHGTRVTLAVLRRVGAAEASLRRLGFAALRVRHYGDTARIELPLEDLGRALEAREEIVATVRAAGYAYVTLDLEGLRSGNLSRRTTSEAAAG